ncbi:hypothetical protein [Streptomyces sp. NPDC088736]|uniref:hypothetical protein n=1 Tax=Streptomyces sp. NPDC088736 TaxID=3365881 RepID=UPI00382CF2C6
MHDQYPPQPPVQPAEPAAGKPSGGRAAGLGCLGVLAFLIVCGVIGAASGSGPDQGQDRADGPRGDWSTSASDTRSDEARATDGDPTVDATPTSSRHALTKLSVTLAWQGFAESRKDMMCAGIDLYGRHWAAEQMAAGSRAGEAQLDWDYAAELVGNKCAER